MLHNDEGESYIKFGPNRRVSVRSFKGKAYVDIREFYGSEGDEKPGKKGISLTVEQWQAIRDNASVIDEMLSEL